MKIAAIQGSPVFMNKEKTLEKMINYIDEAVINGATTCVFPEAFLPGYPWWLYIPRYCEWEEPKIKEAYGIYLENSVEVDGPEVEALICKSKETGVMIISGIMERTKSGGAVYCTLITIHPEKGVINLHRKLMPTFNERALWSIGDGQGLNVYEWDGFKIGGLCCWENWMPLARFSLYSQGENLHIAAFPGLVELTEDITRFIAMEGRSYVVTVGGVLTENDIEDTFPLKQEMLDIRDVLLNGGTYIVGPDGSDVVPMADQKEQIVYAELDPKRVKEERMTWDCAGHSNRHDVLSLNINKTRLSAVKETKGE